MSKQPHHKRKIASERGGKPRVPEKANRLWPASKRQDRKQEEERVTGKQENLIYTGSPHVELN